LLCNSGSKNCTDIRAQCAIPVFDGLLPEPHNERVLQLLFITAHWHGLAKLRMHTDPTLDIMDDTTVSLGQKRRDFVKNTCTAYQTRELHREAEARKCRQSKKPTQAQCNSESSGPPNTTQRPVQLPVDQPSVVPKQPVAHSQSKKKTTIEDASTSRWLKSLNLNTYKNHALGDYTAIIRQYGTTDSYSTESVRIFWLLSPGIHIANSQQDELEHRTSKARYSRTNRRNFIKQLTQIERRETRIRRIRDQLKGTEKLMDEEVASSPDAHYHIGKTQNYPEHIPLFLQKNAEDPAVQVTNIFALEELLTHCL
jgi:hypothetical protein